MWKAGRHTTEVAKPCDVERTFENNDVVLSNQFESFTLSFDCSGSACRVATILRRFDI